MTNFDTLIESMSKIINYQFEPHEQLFVTTIDIKYADSQINLHPYSENHYNFNNVSGDMTGMYRFEPCFYGHLDLVSELQD